MMHLAPETLSHLIATYGYGIVAGMVALEGLGIPLPGETTLILAAVFAGREHRLDIGWVIAAAAAGAMIGDNLGFLIGRQLGYRLLLHYGARIGLTERRLKLGQYLFILHGGKLVFFGRFVALLRTLAALLAGANCMRWRRYILAEAAGAWLWAGLYGFGAYALGSEMRRMAGPLGIGIGAGALAALATGLVLARRHASELEAAAERALPGPLRPARMPRH